MVHSGYADKGGIAKHLVAQLAQAQRLHLTCWISRNPSPVARILKSGLGQNGLKFLGQRKVHVLQENGKFIFFTRKLQNSSHSGYEGGLFDSSIDRKLLRIVPKSREHCEILSSYQQVQHKAGHEEND